MKIALLSILIATCTLGDQPTTQPATQPTTMPATQPAAIKPDRADPLGMCVLFDTTSADLGVEKAIAFYHCTTPAHRRYARAEAEFYVAVNKLIRVIDARHGKDKGRIIRELAGDSDDYSNVKVSQEGDAAAFQREDQTPFPAIRIDGKWYFSMPDWFEIMPADELIDIRLYYEETADKCDEVREQMSSGKITSFEQIQERFKIEQE